MSMLVLMGDFKVECLRCGNCCQTMWIIVVDDPEKGIHPDNLKSIGVNGAERCPHLEGSVPGQMSCLIHDREWYTETPCSRHSQIGAQNSPCRTGQYILSKNV
jgi:hypothetical protein